MSTYAMVPYFRNSNIPEHGYSRHFKFLRELPVCKPPLAREQSWRGREVLRSRRIPGKSFKRFRERRVDLSDSVVLAGPHNAGKSPLLQMVALWKLALHRWISNAREAGRAGGRASPSPAPPLPLCRFGTCPCCGKTGGELVHRAGLEHRDFSRSSWRGCRMARPGSVESNSNTPSRSWCLPGPRGARGLDRDASLDCPPAAATALAIVQGPPLSGIERDEPRRDRGLQDLLVGLGRPGEMLRNLLLAPSRECPGGRLGTLWQNRSETSSKWRC